MKKVEKLGGTICRPRRRRREWLHFAIFPGAEANAFPLWEMNERAK